MTVYPTIEEVLLLHSRLLERFGGMPGLRDRGGLEAALARPQQGYYNDLIEEAASLWESLSQNHPFVDGNKRVAITVTAAFPAREWVPVGIRRPGDAPIFNPALRSGAISIR